MVHRGLVYMPTSTGGNLRMLGRNHIKGKGMGSVLLQTGGAGGGSSYSSINDYLDTTRPSVPTGRGLGSVSKKLESLMLKPSVKKVKNINFSL